MTLSYFEKLKKLCMAPLFMSMFAITEYINSCILVKSPKINSQWETAHTRCQYKLDLLST